MFAEIVPDADLSSRSRGPNEPAFLKPLVNRDFLPALITVLHSIQKCRNVLLSSHHQIDDYGNNAHWWSGESIQTSTITYHADNSSTDEEPSQPAQPVEIEMQRLIAFLDKTERSYGSAEALSRVSIVAEHDSHLTVTRFMKAWDSLQADDTMFRNVIHGLSATGSPQTQDIRLFEVNRPSIQNGKIVSLYEALDNTLWTLQSDGIFDLNHFVQSVAPVMALQIGVHNARNLDVPSELFVDRYMLENSSRMQENNKQNEVHVQNLKQCDDTLDKILKISVAAEPGTAAPNKQLDAIQAFNTSLEYLQARHKEQEGTPEAEKLGKAVQQLQNVITRVEARVTELNEQKEKTKAAMAALSSYMTREEDNPSHRYSLRGVAQSSFRNSTLYAKYPDPDSPKQDRWWRMTYDTGASSASVTKYVVPRTEVYEAAGKGIDKTFLVYVRSDLLDQTPVVPLTSELQAFVDRDNADFKQEIHSASESMEVDQQVGTIENYTFSSRRSSGSSTKVLLGDADDDAAMTESIPRLPVPEDTHMQTQATASQALEEMRDRGGSMFLGRHGQESGQQLRSDTDMEDSSPEPERTA